MKPSDKHRTSVGCCLPGVPQRVQNPELSWKKRGGLYPHRCSTMKSTIKIVGTKLPMLASSRIVAKSLWMDIWKHFENKQQCSIWLETKNRGRVKKMANHKHTTTEFDSLRYILKLKSYVSSFQFWDCTTFILVAGSTTWARVTPVDPSLSKSISLQNLSKIPSNNPLSPNSSAKWWDKLLEK